MTARPEEPKIDRNLTLHLHASPAMSVSIGYARIQTCTPTASRTRPST
jgi:hypothetical protein